MRQLLRLTETDRVFTVDRAPPAAVAAADWPGTAANGAPRANGRPHRAGAPTAGSPGAASPVRQW
ncbi:hypothetical protein [Kitasatospora arboriphila]|uniref:Uncharacterized protein n=1 Tax=Kitasatospora arboriphila TaxID=258052 RepID=A0ABP4E1J6_9ACTN